MTRVNYCSKHQSKLDGIIVFLDCQSVKQRTMVRNQNNEEKILCLWKQSWQDTCSLILGAPDSLSTAKETTSSSTVCCVWSYWCSPALAKKTSGIICSWTTSAISAAVLSPHFFYVLFKHISVDFYLSFYFLARPAIRKNYIKNMQVTSSLPYFRYLLQEHREASVDIKVQLNRFCWNQYVIQLMFF